MKRTKRWMAVLAFSVFACNMQAQTVPVYQDESAPLHERVTDLLKRMTVEEKINLLLEVV